MKFSLSSEGDDVVVLKEFDSDDSGEIAHFMAELDIAKLELLGLWESISCEGSGEDDDNGE